MKNIYLILITILLLPNLGSSQEDEICYTVTYRNNLSIQKGLDIRKLSTAELLNTRTVTYQNQITEVLTNGGDYEKSIKTVYHKNYVPSWYLVPDKILINGEGVTSYFYSTSSIYEGGWQGHNQQSMAPNTSYSVESKSGNKFPDRKYVTHYTTDEFTEYEDMRQLITQTSLITRFTYKEPTYIDIKKWENQGYTVHYDNNTIEIINAEYAMRWNRLNKTTVESFFTNSNLVFETTSYYRWNNELQSDVLFKKVNRSPIILTTGDCAEELNVEYYSDWGSSCNSSALEVRKSENSEVAIPSIAVYPSPASNEINLDLSQVKVDQENNVEIMIYNSFGSTVYYAKTKSNDNITIDINRFSPGIYQIAVFNGSEFTTTSFTKL